MPFADHFSTQAAIYRRFRPRYPDALFDHLAAVAPARGVALDCCTGSGQAASALLTRFATVVAADGSVAQLSQAPRRGLLRASALAERAPLRARCVDLITVAQALHWLDLDAFYAEVRRVARPGAAIAAWCYGLLEATPEIDALVRAFHDGTVGPYWPTRRGYVMEAYRDLAFPFAPIPAPAFAMTARWDLWRLLGYLRTWSACQRYRAARGSDPVDALEAPLLAAWGAPESRRTLRWPLALLLGRIEGP